MTSLNSTLFYIEPTYNRETQELNGYVVYGGGFGHGVGMSQMGAEGMAEAGKSYIEILAHFYRGVELTSMY